MKTFKILGFLVIALFIFGNVNAKNDKKSKFKTVVFSANLHCKSCVAKIEKNLAYEKGVRDINVSLKNNTVKVKYVKAKNSDVKLLKSLRKLGFQAVIVKKKSACKCSGCKPKHKAHKHTHKHKSGCGCGHKH